MKKNILFIIESSETGGAENVFAELVGRIDRNLYTPYAALLYNGWLFDRLTSDGEQVCLLPNSNGGFDYQLLQGLFVTIKRLNIDLVHSHLFTTNVYSSLCGTLLGVPVISTFHGTVDVNPSDRMKRLKWQVINRCSRKIVFVSNYLQEYFVSRKLASATKAEVIYNGIEIDRFQKGNKKELARIALNVNADCYVVGCVGDLRPSKDYRTALVSIAMLKKYIPQVKLVIVGTITELLRDLEVEITSLGISEDVIFIGFHPEPEIVFPAFDVYLSSSVSEGFSLTVIEALAAGLPVVATRSGGPEEIITHGETGMLVDVRNPHEIVNAIVKIYKDMNLRSELKEAGLMHVESNFSVQKMVDRYQKLYCELTSS